MISPKEAINLGKTKYLNEYEDAINVLWKYNKQITPEINIASFLIAQAVQESRFDAKAVSLAGAVGIAQFMKPTAEQMAKELKPKLSLFKNGFDRQNPIQSIWAQVYYMNKLFKVWDLGRVDEERLKLAFASYNAGIRNILKAQKISGNKKFWNEIKLSLHLITGKNSEETITYVDNIFKYVIDVA
ncbi:MAG: transglycosylase SLT domain-containing protein [Arcobacteraceae bacterium]|nr:transglycosylase SLT domain-containing protein [Arcobacteraceae bacterium]